MEEWVQPSEEERREMEHYERLADQRGFDRQRHTAEITFMSETNFYMGFSENISEGGLFLATLSPPAIGAAVALFVKVPDGDEIPVDGVVRWHRTTESGQPTGCGVEFVDLDPRARDAFEGLIRQLSKEPLFFEI